MGSSPSHRTLDLVTGIETTAGKMAPQGIVVRAVESTRGAGGRALGSGVKFTLAQAPPAQTESCPHFGRKTDLRSIFCNNKVAGPPANRLFDADSKKQKQKEAQRRGQEIPSRSPRKAMNEHGAAPSPSPVDELNACIEMLR